MSRPDPIQYAERLYTAIRAANFSPISFLAFGNAIKDGVDFRRMPRMAAEPFMRVVGEMLELEGDAAQAGDIVDAEVASGVPAQAHPDLPASAPSIPDATLEIASPPLEATSSSPEPTTGASPRRPPRARH
jgi:hypothetical protein